MSEDPTQKNTTDVNADVTDSSDVTDTDETMAAQADAQADAGAAIEAADAEDAADDSEGDIDSDDESPWELDPAEQIVALEAEIAEHKDKTLRALAEAENVRRRGERDKIDATKYAITNFAREMVTVADNLRRALASVPEEGRKESEVVENLVLGVEMTEREMLNAFERSGIARIDAMDKLFDHNFHQALFEIEDLSVPAGTVVQEVESGFTLNDRLLRPAKVAVSKGGPKPVVGTAASEEPAAAADQSASGQDAYEQRVDADRPPNSGTQVDTEP